MLTPLIIRQSKTASSHPRQKNKQSGFTMALVAVSMVAIISMAALSIDIGTLYEAKAEAQRSADAAALAAARTISISGITGDPATGGTDGSWGATCGGASSLATLTAVQVAQQNLVAGASIPTANVTVSYGAGPTNGSPSADCSGLGSNFAVNPIVTVKVQRTNLPIFFARVFSILPGVTLPNPSVSATASAEAYNPSNSAGVAAAGMIPVNPRCVKPFIIPNTDPKFAWGSFVSLTDGAITKAGLTPAGTIGEEIFLAADCNSGPPHCIVPGAGMIANPPTLGPPANTVRYIPALVQSNAGAAPACSATNDFSKAIVGCDQSTVYACGMAGAAADLAENPVTPTGSGDAFTSVQCLTNAGTGGQDNIAPGVVPFQIQAGLNNPLVAKGLVPDNDLITTSNSIATIPIYDSVGTLVGAQPAVTIVGFLQVFIKSIDTSGTMDVIVMNVAGCSNSATNPPVAGTSPVPVRLITPP